jgi:hypothetical protein
MFKKIMMFTSDRTLAIVPQVTIAMPDEIRAQQKVARITHLK